MFARILVPLDGSPLAEEAVPVAAHIARATGGTVLLLRALAPATLGCAGPALAPYAGPGPELIEQETTDATSYLTRVSGWPALSGIAVETDVAVGSAAPAVLQLAEDWRADLVMLTTHGRTGLSRWVLGSVAQHLARQSTVPVLVLRSTNTETTSTGAASAAAVAPFAHCVLVPLDGSAMAEAALAPAAALSTALAHPAPGELHLLLVVDRSLGALTAAPEALVVGGAQGYLERLAHQVTSAHGAALRVSWSVSVESDIAATILRVSTHGTTDVDATSAEGSPSATDPAATNPAGYDLIAMATHGRTGFARWALGSVTERVLQGSRLPLLVVRPLHINAEASPLAAEHTY